MASCVTLGKQETIWLGGVLMEPSMACVKEPSAHPSQSQRLLSDVIPQELSPFFALETGSLIGLDLMLEQVKLPGARPHLSLPSHC